MIVVPVDILPLCLLLLLCLPLCCCFRTQLAFVRQCLDEIPLPVPAVLGAWDDGALGPHGVENFLIALNDVASLTHVQHCAEVNDGNGNDGIHDGSAAAVGVGDGDGEVSEETAASSAQHVVPAVDVDVGEEEGSDSNAGRRDDSADIDVGSRQRDTGMSDGGSNSGAVASGGGEGTSGGPGTKPDNIAKGNNAVADSDGNDSSASMLATATATATATNTAGEVVAAVFVEAEPELHPSLPDEEAFRNVLQDLAQFHGYFYDHAMVVSISVLW